MKILAIGGSGGMGRFTVRTAEEFSNVKSLVVADLNGIEAKAFASSLGSKVTGIGLDVLDSNALIKAMQDVDVVLNTSGPFFKLGVLILEAAIESGCHYLDICDDWEPTINMLKLDEKAKEKEISAIIGLGASPGMSNLLGLMAIRELDGVEKIYTGWNMAGAKPEEESSQKGANAAMEHAIEQMTGKIKVFQDGEFKLIRPMERVNLDYPGSGKASAHIFGHPEAVTFPIYFSELKESLNLAHGNEDGQSITTILLSLVEWHFLPKRTAARLFGWLENNMATSDLADLPQSSLPTLYGLALGEKNGKKEAVGVSIGHAQSKLEKLDNESLGMGAVTGIPLACGLKMLLDGRINNRGVFAPESGAINPEEFFSEVFSVLTEDTAEKIPLEDFIKVSRSWEKS